MIVTLTESRSDIVEDIQKNFPQAQIMILPNRGYDVGPFVHIINQVNLDEYSYVVHLHTKRNMQLGTMLNHNDVSGAKWRNYALAFFKNEEKIKQCFSAFEKNAHLGMVADYHLIAFDEGYDKTATLKAKELVSKLGLSVAKCGFVMGTMFICRAQLLKPVQALNIQIDDFEEPSIQNQHTTLAHVLERFLGFIVFAQGYTIQDATKKTSILWYKFMDFWAQIKTFIYRRKIDKQGRVRVKICKIPVPYKWVNRRS